MSFLEQRGRPYPIIAPYLQRLTTLSAFLPSARYWALTWSVLHLLSFSFGGWFAGFWHLKHQIIPPENQFLILSGSAVLPAFLFFGSKPKISFVIWLAVFLLGTINGYEESRSRFLRTGVTAESPMAPSLKTVFHLKTAVRFTAWASSKAENLWQCPAVIIGDSLGFFPGGLTISRGEGIFLKGQGKPPLPGEIRAVVLQITIPDGSDLPGMFDYQKFLKGRGILWQGKIIDEYKLPGSGFESVLFGKILTPFRTSILSQIKLLLPPNEASLASAVLLGVKDDASRESSHPFADLGLAHLFAVSGLHVGVLLALVLLPGKLFGVSAFKKWFLMIAILPPYTLLTGLPGSVIRASGLAMLSTAGSPFGRIGNPLHFLGLLFWITTLWQPDQVLDTGVRLSYAAAAGILSFTTLSKGIKYPRKGFRGFLLGGLFISLAAQWFTLPLAAASFGRISLISPLANLVAVPTFGIGVWLVVLSLVGSGIFLEFGIYLGALAWVVFRSLSGIVKISEISTGGWNMGLPVPGLVLILQWLILTAVSLMTLQKISSDSINGKTGFLFISLCGLFCLAGFSGLNSAFFKPVGPEVWQFDVGQGDCAVVRFPDGWTAMIDAAGRFGFSGKSSSGPLSRNIHPWLRRYGNENFDAVVLTHAHGDHTGGAEYLHLNSEVGQWQLSKNVAHFFQRDSTDSCMNLPTTGQILHQWDEWSLKVLYPFSDMPEDFHENDYSIVIGLFRNQNLQFLWSGDLEKEGESLLLSQGVLHGSTKIWKAGHHGSNTSGSQPFLDTIAPELIIISCGVGNSYHHPSHGLYVVENDTIPIVRTDLEGSVYLRFKKDGAISWKSSRRGGLLPATP